MFRAIESGDSRQLLGLGEKLARQGHHPAAFLCLDRVFSVPVKLQAATLPEIARTLQTFHVYVRMLQKLWAFKNPCSDPEVCQVFSIERSTEDLFLLTKGSLLASHHNGNLTPSARETDQGILIPRWELEKLFKYVLRERLLKRVND